MLSRLVLVFLDSLHVLPADLASVLLVCLLAGYILLRLTGVFVERAAPELPFRLYPHRARDGPSALVSLAGAMTDYSLLRIAIGFAARYQSFHTAHY